MVSFSILKEHLREIFEPQASSVKERIHLIREVKKFGGFVGILAMPFLPYITDSQKRSPRIHYFFETRKSGFCGSRWPHFKTRKQKDLFMNIIEKKFPHLLKEYQYLYSENRLSGAPLSSYSSLKNQEWQTMLRKEGLLPFPLRKVTIPRFQDSKFNT